jgi:hypothetical protein
VVSGKPAFVGHSIPSNKELTSPIKDLREQSECFQKIRKEILMVNVSEEAEKVLLEYFEGKEISPIRVFLQTGG